MVNLVIRVKRGDPRVLLELSLFDFVIQLFFSFGYDYNASVRIVVSQFNHQIVSLLKRPLTHY